MKIRKIGILVLTAILVMSSIAALPNNEIFNLTPHSQSIDTVTTDSTPALRLNLSYDPVPDPAKATDLDSVFTIEQLFIGLFDIDDETGEARPELATSWDVSLDGLTYTFTLRDDSYWTDGNPITAFDAEYGILRTLDPDTGAGYAYLLFLIENASEYRYGTITDPDQVGVTALDATHLQITLNEPAAYLPAILGMWVSRPMPQSAIDAWGDAWTEPGHIITSGPYKLSAWVHDDHMTLEKHDGYYDAANVQIQQIDISLFSDSSIVWQMYLDGELDTAPVPLPELDRLDPITQQEYHRGINNCTYYYGFTNTKPPLDDVRVRKAFAMSVNKESLVADVLKGGQFPANFFAPPGNFGAPSFGSVGLNYDPATARTLLQEYLTEKGLDLQGFNDLGIVLMHNTSEGHRIIAEAIQADWLENLGVNVTIEDLEWSEYLQIIQNTTPVEDIPHIWRLGWCSDYPDENNWVHGVFNNQVGSNDLRRGCLDPNCGTEVPLEFDLITAQAKVEQDPEVRKDLYFQAERLLAEEEAAYLPLYFYSRNDAAKLYLQRTYSNMSLLDVSTWQLTIVNTTVEPTGGSLISYDGQTTINIPSGAIDESVQLTQSPTAAPLPDIGLLGVGQAFDLSAVYTASGQPAQLLPGSTYSITIQYADDRKGFSLEDTLGLYYWDGTQWVKELSSIVDTQSNTVTATPNHFSVWRLFEETKVIYLPIVKR